MAAKLLMIKSFGRLLPADEAAAEALNRIKMNEVVTVEVKRPRNVRMHRLYWALIGIVWDNIDHERYASPDDLHAAVKIAAGLRTRIELPGDVVGFIPGSIAFDKMDQVEFDVFYDRVCNVVAKYFIPGLDIGQLRTEVETMIGMRAA